MKFIISIIISFIFSFLLFICLFLPIMNPYILLAMLTASLSLFIVGLILLNIGIKQSRNPKFKKYKEFYLKHQKLRIAIIGVVIFIDLFFYGFLIYACYYQSQHLFEMQVDTKDITTYIDGTSMVDDVEIKKRNKEEKEVFEETFTVPDYSGRVLTCGTDLPADTYIITDSEQDGNTMLFSAFNDGEGIAQGEFVDMHDPFTCYTGKQLKAYNDTGSFTVRTYTPIDVRDNYETVTFASDYELDKWTGEVVNQSCYLIDSDENTEKMTCSELKELSSEAYSELSSDSYEFKESTSITSLTINGETHYYDSYICSEPQSAEKSLHMSDDSYMCLNENTNITESIFGMPSLDSKTIKVWDTDIEDGSLNY